MAKYTLWDGQVDDLAFYIKKKRWLNASDPGTGKTPSTAVWFQYLWEHKGVKSCFVGPKSLLMKNKNEIHLFTDFKDNEVVIVDGTPAQRKEQINSPNAKVLLMGYKRFSDDYGIIMNSHPKMNAVVVDEWHLGYKKDGSKRVAQLYRAMDKIEYFGALSGTFVDGSLETVYPAFRIIQPRYYSSYMSFMLQHAIKDVYGSVVGWTNHGKIGKIMRLHSIRKTFEEVHGKEEPVFAVDICKMFPAQERAYDQMHSCGMLELEDYFLMAEEAGVNAIRCNQILACPEHFGIKGINGKDEVLKVHLENHKRTNKPLIVFASSVPEQQRITRLVKSLGMTVQLINGTSKNKNIDAEFREGKFQVVVASPVVASVGYNWGHVDHIIFASVDYSDSNFVQAYRRGIRGKRDKPLLVTLLHYPHTIERRKFQILDEKSRMKVKVDGSYSALNLTNLVDKATSFV